MNIQNHDKVVLAWMQNNKPTFGTNILTELSHLNTEEVMPRPHEEQHHVQHHAIGQKLQLPIPATLDDLGGLPDKE